MVNLWTLKAFWDDEKNSEKEKASFVALVLRSSKNIFSEACFLWYGF